MFGAAVKSAVGHAVAIALAWAGLPGLFDEPPPADTVIVVEMVAVAARRNLPSGAAAQAAPEAVPAPARSREADSAPAALAPPPAAPPRRAAPEAAPTPRVPPAPKPEAAAARLPDDIRRPSRKPRPPARMDFDSALAQIADMADAPPAAEAAPVDPLLAAQDMPFRPEAAPSMTEIDAIRTQIQRNWAVPAGAADAHEMVVTLRLRLGPDGTVQSVEVVEQARMRHDSFFRTMAESAVRAVRRTKRIRNLSADTYRGWRDIKVRFNPKDMFG